MTENENVYSNHCYRYRTAGLVFDRTKDSSNQNTPYNWRELVLSATVEMCKVVFGEEATNKD